MNLINQKKKLKKVLERTKAGQYSKAMRILTSNKCYPALEVQHAKRGSQCTPSLNIPFSIISGLINDSPDN